jgi:hypothetical protein
LRFGIAKLPVSPDLVLHQHIKTPDLFLIRDEKLTYGNTRCGKYAAYTMT